MKTKQNCGVYKYVMDIAGDQKVVYIGMTKNSFKSRIEAHNSCIGVDEKFRYFIDKCEIYIAYCANPTEAAVMEKLLINKYKPILNVADNYDGYSGSISFVEPDWISWKDYLNDAAKKKLSAKSKTKCNTDDNLDAFQNCVLIPSDAENHAIIANSILSVRNNMNKCFMIVFDILLECVFYNSNPMNLRYVLHVKDYKDRFDLTYNNNAYRKLRDSCDIINKNPITLVTSNCHGRMRKIKLFDSVEYKMNGVITIELSADFKRHLVNEFNAFGKGENVVLALHDTSLMRSIYSKKMYPVLLDSIDNSIVHSDECLGLTESSFKRIDSWSELKSFLCVPKSYSTSQVKDICHLICDEINKHTLYRVNVEFTTSRGKQGRYPKISQVLWHLNKKSA